jgi:hypothetical protein
MNSLLPRLRDLDRQISKRSSLVTRAYSAALLMAVALCWFFPFPISRVGSVVLTVALAYMIGKFREAGRSAWVSGSSAVTPPLQWELAKIDAQVRLLRSAIYYLPFVVGINLFWTGLPGPGTSEQKALLDCIFLAATVMIFTGVYLLNQRTVRRELLPLRMELESMLTPTENSGRILGSTTEKVQADSSQ